MPETAEQTVSNSTLVRQAEKDVEKRAGKYDVFLCYNSRDLDQVRIVSEQLRMHGVRPWLDVEEIPPGALWKREITRQISSVGSAAVFVGRSGPAPWRDAEIDLILTQFIRSRKPIIPVILEGRRGQPRLPNFLSLRRWVDMRVPEPHPIQQLIWGITGQEPKFTGCPQN